MIKQGKTTQKMLFSILILLMSHQSLGQSGVNSGCLTSAAPANLAMPAIPTILSGKIGLYVAQLAPGNDFKTINVISLNQNDVFPLASSFKTSVLFEFLRQVDAKKHTLEDRFQINTSNRSIEKYPYNNSTALTLMNRMIKNSDNTATDVLMRRVGLKSMQDLFKELNLCKTRVLMPTKTWWTIEAGLGGKDFPANDLLNSSNYFAKAKPEEQLAIVTRVDQLAQKIDPKYLETKLDDYFKEKIVTRSKIPIIDRNIQNSSTPYEWAHFLHQAFVANKMSTLAKGVFRQVAATEDTQKYLKIPFVYFGGKDGYTAYIRTITGYIETPDGKRAIYVYFNEDSKRFDTYNTTPQAFELINAALTAVLK